jgi:flagellar export protein FliJ
MELAKAQHQLILAEEHLASLKARNEDAESRMAHCLQKGVMGRKLQLWRLYLTDLQTSIDEEDQRTEAMRLAVEDLRVRLLEANRKKKSMEKLSHREEQAWRQKEDRREQKELSEMAVQLHTRRSS